MTIDRMIPTVARLPDGRILIAGGTHGDGWSGFINEAELYNPTNGTFKVVWPSMASSRGAAAAAILQDGRVLLAGGCISYLSQGSGTDTAELYVP